MLFCTCKSFPYLKRRVMQPRHPTMIRSSEGLAKFIWRILDIKYTPFWSLTCAFILEHARVQARILSFDLQPCLGRHSVEDKVVVAMRAVFVRLFELAAILAEAFLAFLASEDLGGDLVGSRRKGEMQGDIVITFDAPCRGFAARGDLPSLGGTRRSRTTCGLKFGLERKCRA